jgi:putative endonuclease
MTYFVYILYSKKLDKYYVGKSNNPQNRLIFHNSTFNRIWTKRGQPWQLKKVLKFEDSTEASKAERFIKRQKSRKLIERIIENGWESI